MTQLDTSNLNTINRGDRLITVNGVSKIYNLKKQKVYALNNVSLEIFRSEYLSIMGPSGSGKSTLFNIVGALDRPSEGNVAIGPLDLTKLSSRQLAFVRCTYIGYIFQAYNLIPSLTALRNVALPRIFTGEPPKQAEEAAAKRLEQVGLAHRLDHRPDELSGGQQQRVAIARALVNDPTIILADEPTANLDLNTGGEIITILKDLSSKEGVTIITATHDHKMLANSDRVLWIKDGQVDKIQTADELEIEEGDISVGGESME
ncbi:ABC transporter ATP-binding protein [Phycisphaerales bacterium AB-hyl4]|uniref:ABC transporter ATP-binding protein n=1 Tax=Natronomicrosphaera hydrolytica TaxID=3242702 RepID=A0ABV4UB58_9BACT